MSNGLKLKQILNLVGKLDDTLGENTPRERFRVYLRENVTNIDLVRKYVEECLETTGEQYNYALQDLVNHLGILMGFEVEFGRYKGISGENGFDGNWKSPLDFNIVAETKTTDVYPIKTNILLGYINDLISNKKILDSKKVLGLYIIGKADPEFNQLENTIIVENHPIPLRIISIDALLSLANLMYDYNGLDHKDILAILRPSGPTINKSVNLLLKVLNNTIDLEEKEKMEPLPQNPDVRYWITPVKSHKNKSAEKVIKELIVDHGEYVFSDRTPGRKHIKVGDRICFYSSGKGTVADARVFSELELRKVKYLDNPDDFPWAFKVDDVKTYFDKPIKINENLRTQMEEFENRDINKSWAWFVMGTKEVCKEDFYLLIGK